jgi:hypothetical protein
MVQTRSRSTTRLDEDGELEKLCTRCQDWWPATTEFFYADGDKLTAYCKACWQERRNELHPPKRKKWQKNVFS